MTNPTDHPPERNARDEFVAALDYFGAQMLGCDIRGPREKARAEVLRLYDEADTAVKHRDVAEKEAERWFQIADSTMRILTAIHALLHPPLVTTPDGQTFAFKSPVLDEQVQALSDRIRAIPGELAAYGAPPKAEPAGWRMVPVEPTPEMIEAVSKVMLARIMSKRDGRGIKFGIIENWQTMIQAAPTHDADNKEPK